MKVREMLEMIDSTKKNEVEDGVKIRWINDVESKVFCDVLKKRPEDFCGVEGEECLLSLPDAYARVYLLYVWAMIELAEGHGSDYSALKQCFESELSAYARSVIRNR